MDDLTSMVTKLSKEGFDIEFSYWDVLDCIRVRIYKDHIFNTKYILIEEERCLPFILKEMAIEIKEGLRIRWREEEYERKISCNT